MKRVIKLNVGMYKGEPTVFRRVLMAFFFLLCNA